jgi:hypothetical protein
MSFTAQPQPSQDQPNFSDGSEPLFIMYVERAEKEDKELADRWQKDADGILIFVSIHVSPHKLTIVTSIIIVDRFILCRSCGIRCSFDPGFEAKSTGYLCILSREHLSTTRRPEHISCIHPCQSSSTTPILSTDICSLGQLIMVPELGY